MFWKNKKTNEELINEYSVLDKKELLKKRAILQNEINSVKYKEINFNTLITIIVSIFLSMITIIGTGIFKGVDIIKYSADFLKNSDKASMEDTAKAIKDSADIVIDFLNMIAKPKGFFAMLIILALVSFFIFEGINMMRYYNKSKYMRHLEFINTILDNYDIMHESKEDKNDVTSVKKTSPKKEIKTQQKNKSTSLGWIFMIISLKSSYRKIKDRK